MEKSGQSKKAALYASAMQMTKDFENGARLCQGLRDQIEDAKSNVIEPLNDQLTGYDAKSSEIDEQIEVNLQKIEDLKKN